MKILMATKNEGKIEGARRAFSRYFDNIEIKGIPADSEVGAQPVNEDIYKGAKNRIRNLRKYAKENGIEADFFIASESGIFDSLGRWLINNIAVIEDNDGYEGYGTSASFPVPERLVKDIIDTELSVVMDKVYYENKERHNQGGAIFDITKGAISRIDLTESAFIMALTKFINGDTWK